MGLQVSTACRQRGAAKSDSGFVGNPVARTDSATGQAGVKKRPACGTARSYCRCCLRHEHPVGRSDTFCRVLRWAQEREKARTARNARGNLAEYEDSGTGGAGRAPEGKGCPVAAAARRRRVQACGQPPAIVASAPDAPTERGENQQQRRDRRLGHNGNVVDPAG